MVAKMTDPVESILCARYLVSVVPNVQDVGAVWSPF